MHALRSASLLATVAVILASCSRHEDAASTAKVAPSAVAPRTATAPTVGARTSVRGAADRARFAFHVEGNAWVVRDARFAARADATSLRFAPTGSDDALVLDAAAIARDAPIALDAAKPSATNAGHLTLDRGAVHEELASSAEGVEQSWTFASRPAGSGDLVFTLGAHGLAYATSTAGGLHFGAHANGVRYGVATWVDARGVRTPVTPTMESGAIVIRVPSQAVDGATYPATLDPIISSETALDSPPDYVPAAGSQTRPAAAWNGTDDLVVWSDPRNALGSGGNTVITGARFSSTGVLLDPTGLVLSAQTIGGEQHEVTPAIASEGNGKTFLVAWADNTTVSTATVSAGVASGAIFVDDSHVDSAPAVAFASPNYLVVWQSGPAGVLGARVSTANVALDTTPIAIAPACTSAPTIASNGTGYLVGCSDATDVYLTAVSAAGVVGNQATITVSTAPSAIGIGSDGNDFLGCATLAGSNGAVGCILVDGTLTTAINGNVAPGNGYDGTFPSLSIAYYSGEYVIAFTTTGTAPGTYALRGLLVNQDGSTPDADGGVGGVTFVDEKTTSRYPFLLASSVLGVGWQDDRNGSDASDVYAAGLSGALAVVSSEILVTEDATTETNASIGSDGTDFLVAYEHDETTSDASIYALRVGFDGTPIDAKPIPVESATGAGTPFVANPNGLTPGWIVLWQIENIQATIMTPVGAVPGSPGIVTVSTATQFPSAACDGTECLIVWQDGVNAGATGQDIYGLVVGNSGNGPPTAIVQAAGDQTMPSVATTGTGFLVSYLDGTSVKAIHVGRSGTTVLPGTIEPITTTAGAYNRPQVASDGSNYFLTFDDGSTIWGANVLTAGGVSGSLLSVSAGTTARSNAAVAWDGYQYVVAWQDQRNGDYDIFAARVANGSVVDATGFPVAAATEDETNPALAGEGGRISAVAYQSQHAGSSGTRIYVRTISDKLADGAPCTGGDECTDKACVDQVCCQATCTGVCTACSNALTGAADGVCTAVINGTDPHGSCAGVVVPFSCESETCETGSCQTVISQGCLVSSACFAAGAQNPSNPCQTCQPLISKTAFTDDDGAPCADVNLCDVNPTCHAGACIPTSHVTCTALDQCHIAGSCISATGLCANPNADDGTACNDGNACTQTDVCQSGTCTGGNPVSCTASDQCHVAGTCTPSSGKCTNPNKSDGAVCTDGNACTQNDTCQSGTCAGGNPVVCMPSNQCHVAGTCNTSNGSCSNPLAPNSCDISSACFASGATDGSNTCQTCQPSTSTSQFTPLANGAACTPDSLACTIDECEIGQCEHIVAPTSCLIVGVCYAQGTVNPSNACQICTPSVSQIAWTATPCVVDAGPANDAGSDAGTDAGTDAGIDAGTDAGSDAGTDAGSDAGTDAGSDAGTDAGSDAGSDAGPDAGTDAGTDAGGATGTDAGTDAGSDDSDAGNAESDAGNGELDATTGGEDGAVAHGDDSGEDNGDGGAGSGATGDSAGCGCRTTPTESDAPFAPLAALVAVVALRRRRGRR